MNDESSAVGFTGLLELASAAIGGRIVSATDEFFAEASNMLLPGRGTFIPGKFTDRGKWMDGWESRRRRGPGHDACIIELGATGTVASFDIDTNHFLGNHPAFASVEGARAPRGSSVAELERSSWVELLAPSPLRPGSQNLFVAGPARPVSHVRLRIYPDGGVARFRVYGKVLPGWQDARDAITNEHVPDGLVDLAATLNGGLALACSNAFFGPMNNLISPGRAQNMGDGWETRRSRHFGRDGNDWIVVRLGARGLVRVAEIDTNHFKGNFPESCSLDGIDAQNASLPDLVQSTDWFEVFGRTELAAHERRFIGSAALASLSPVTHVRLNVFPDGGVSRLRLWGDRT